MKQSLLYPGQAFGEMSLLMNYKRTANIRAATYVEVCIFNRQAFQNIISRYPEDRRRVLTTMLKSCIEKKDIPFPWDEVIDAVSERRRQNGTLGSSRLKVHTPVTSTEAAEALVDRIDVNKPDESIKYGFQTFHPDLKIPPLVGDNTATSDSASALRLKSQGARSSMTDDLTSPDQASSPAEPRVEDLKTTLSTMMTLMNSMAEKIERLEMHIYNRNDVCCMRGLEVPCAMHKNSGILNMDSNLSQYTIAEGREASYTNTRFRRSRRRNSTSSIISISGIQHQIVMGQDNKEEMTDKTSYLEGGNDR
ncbi:unnamed protein product [Phytophthora lilii]|uniref:Unnamed protein product n=1 Tax=Phytophthora lilii TaxID=2077276 RepID=A0A9W6WPT5_9STRA|nr:unnamed protein product [Phytophthora lilii]